MYVPATITWPMALKDFVLLRERTLLANTDGEDKLLINEKQFIGSCFNLINKKRI